MYNKKKTIKINIRGKNNQLITKENDKRIDNKSNYLKVLVTGSNKYQNSRKIKESIFQFKEIAKQENKELYIACRAESFGVDKYVQNICIKLGLQYGEFPTYDKTHHSQCIMPPYKFGRYDTTSKSYYVRNSDCIKWADYILLFKNEKENNTDVNNMIKMCNSKNKQFIVIS